MTNTLDSGTGSLRQAITDANANFGIDEISFNIPGGGVHTIQPLTELPAITDRVIIDGYTQPGANANTLAVGSDATLLIELNGSLGGVISGLVIDSGNTTIRGLVIRDFDAWSVNLQTNSYSCRITGNYIGTDPYGTSSTYGDLHSGIKIASPDHEIGGLSSADRNIISGFKSAPGIEVYENADGTVIRGNYIGTDRSGTSALGNPEGILLSECDNVIIGGTTPAARNVISGNRHHGISMISAENHQILGNYIGVGADGFTELSKAVGIFMKKRSRHNTIGDGTLSGANRIARNSAGIIVNIDFYNQLSYGNTIRGNSIYRNEGGLGIDLYRNMVSLNDPSPDIDPGANRLQNFPELSFAENVAGPGTRVTGDLYSSPNGTFTIEIFGNMLRDPSGYGEGEFFLGSFDVITDGSGHASFDQTVAASPGPWITSTATRTATGDTSEFSAIIAVEGQQTYAVTNTNDSGPGSLREAITLANASTNTNVIVFVRFDIPTGGAPYEIDLSTPLPNISAPVYIQGSSQPDASPGQPLIVIKSTAGIGGAPMTAVTAGNVTIEGLSIQGDAGAGVVSLADGTSVIGCRIGVDHTGTVTGYGDLPDLVVFNGGEACALHDNVLGGAFYDAVWLNGVRDGFLGKNRIGVGVNDEYLGNSAAGILLTDAEWNVLYLNQIANSFYEGVSIAGNSKGNRLTRNSIYDNGQLSVDLVFGGYGVTPNDFQDLDTGPNGLQNFADLELAGTGANTVQINGTFNGEPHSEFLVEFYANDSVDPSGHGEGKQYIGRAFIQTDENGDAVFFKALDVEFLAGPFISSTVTPLNGGTSEFSETVIGTPLSVIIDYSTDGLFSHLEYTTVSGLYYSVWAKEDLAGTNGWSQITGFELGDGSSETAVFTNPFPQKATFRMQVTETLTIPF